MSTESDKRDNPAMESGHEENESAMKSGDQSAGQHLQHLLETDVDLLMTVVVVFGEVGSATLELMTNASKIAIISWCHHADRNVQVDERIMKTAMLFLVLDPSRQQDLTEAVALADRAKQAGILTLCCCCVGADVEANGLALELIKSHVDSLFIVTGDQQQATTAGTDWQGLIQSMAVECQTIVRAISDPMTMWSWVALDFEDERTVLTNRGYATVAVGRGHGRNRAKIAAGKALITLLAKGIDLKACPAVFVQILSDATCGLDEFSDVGELVEHFFSEDWYAIVSAVTDDNIMDGCTTVYVVVAGLSREIAFGT